MIFVNLCTDMIHSFLIYAFRVLASAMFKVFLRPSLIYNIGQFTTVDIAVVVWLPPEMVGHPSPPHPLLRPGGVHHPPLLTVCASPHS